MGTTPYIALLRGINVGGKNKLPMRALVGLFEAAGAREVRTFIQSGNVLFQSPPSRVKRVAAEVQRGIHAEFGYTIPVLTRAADEFRAVLKHDPFKQAPREQLYFGFLDTLPRAGAKLDPDRSPPDEVRRKGRELYLCLPNGAARTRFTNAYLDKTLGAVTTVRNWKTVNKLAELCG